MVGLLLILIIGLIFAVIAISSLPGKDDYYEPTNTPKRSFAPKQRFIPKYRYESEKERYGRYGEEIATSIILEVLNENDYLYTNVEISFEDKKTELDNVIVNKYGVFIIEVKNYKGRLYGNEDDYEWEKYKDDGYGDTFVKEVRNPIKQVKRQTYILAKYLESSGVRIWVEGYAIFLHGNSPVDSDYVLQSMDDIDKAIHTFKKNHLSKKDVDTIRYLLYSADNNQSGEVN